MINSGKFQGESKWSMTTNEAKGNLSMGGQGRTLSINWVSQYIRNEESTA